MSDIERGTTEDSYLYQSDDIITEIVTPVSSFESTEEEDKNKYSPYNDDSKDKKSPRFAQGWSDFTPRRFFQKTIKPTSKSKDNKEEEKEDKIVENVDWNEYVIKESKRLIRKCRSKAKRSGFYATIFAFLNDITGLYIILFSIATFIASSISTDEDEIIRYVIVGLAGVATFLESVQMLFKYKKRSVYFKQASIQYKRIYRKLSKYLYTSTADDMAKYLSLAYQDVDNLALNDHRANFNRFGNSYRIRIQGENGDERTQIMFEESSE